MPLSRPNHDTPAALPGADGEICGDGHLSWRDRLRYLAFNLVRNLRGAFRKGPARRRFTATRRRETPPEASPARALMEAFLVDRLPRLRAPGDIHVIEIGCGSGSLSRRLAAIGYRGTYQGIDLVDRFDVSVIPEAFAARFTCIDAHRFVPDHPVDLLISVSALEHIPEDGRLIARLRNHLAPGGLQVHLVPGPWGLATYLWHGLRQYGRGAVADRFPQGAEVWAMGGLFSFLVHLGCITIPEILFRVQLRADFPQLYRTLSGAALKADRLAPVCATTLAIIERAPDR